MAKLPLSDRMIAFLKSTPNSMATDWEIMAGLYHPIAQGDCRNGGRISSIRKIARKDDRFQIVRGDSRVIALA